MSNKTVNSSRSAVLVPSEGPATGHPLQPKWGAHPWGAGTLQDRFDAVAPLLQGESVLDVGMRFPLRQARLAARPPVGAIPRRFRYRHRRAGHPGAPGAGYAVQLADAEDFDLGRRFDTVFAGEVIEHLDNVHGFLSSVRRHLAPGGRLVLTTPNAFYVGCFVYRWGGHGQVHPQHTCWYCEDTLRHVLKANGYTKVKISFTGHNSPTPMRKAATFTARHVLPPRLALDTIVAVASAD